VHRRERVERQEEVRTFEGARGVTALQPVGLGRCESADRDSRIAEPQPSPGAVLDPADRRVGRQRFGIAGFGAQRLGADGSDAQGQEQRKEKHARRLAARPPGLTRPYGSLRTRVAHENVGGRETIA
jgi:hypothetical protein